MKIKTNPNNEFYCEAGCKVFYGGEIKHHKDCVYYPDSLSQLIDEKDGKIRELQSLLNTENESGVSDSHASIDALHDVRKSECEAIKSDKLTSESVESALENRIGLQNWCGCSHRCLAEFMSDKDLLKHPCKGWD